MSTEAIQQLVILSGKGGTGKTSVAAAFAHLAAEGEHPRPVVLADADVDAANLELVLNPETLESGEFWAGQTAEIDQALCAGCGICQEVCRFEAIHIQQGQFRIDPSACEGCAACATQCPEEAISMVDQMAGHWTISQTRFGPLSHAALLPAQDNSGHLVTVVKQRSKPQAVDRGIPLIIVDGPPGIGCPVIAAISGANAALLVAEPTLSGLQDMERAYQTVRHFGVPALACINKADLNSPLVAEMQAFCEQEGLQVVGTIPYDETITQAMVNGQPVTAYRPEAPASQALRTIWTQVTAVLEE